MEPGLHVVLAFIAGVHKTVLALVVELHQHAHGAPHGPPEGAELQMFVPGQRQEGISAIHEVTRHQGVRVHDRGQGVCHRACDQPYHKEHLERRNGGEPIRETMSVNQEEI